MIHTFRKNRHERRVGFLYSLLPVLMLLAGFVLLPCHVARAAIINIPGIGNTTVPNGGGIVAVPGLGNITVPAIGGTPTSISIPEIGNFNVTSLVTPSALTSLNAGSVAGLPSSVLNAVPTGITGAVLPALTSGNLNTVLTTLTPGNVGGALTSLTSGNLNGVVSQITGGNLNTILPSLSSGNLSSVTSLLNSGNANGVISSLTSGNLNTVTSMLNSGATNNIFSQLSAGNTNGALSALTSGNLNTAINQFTSGTANSVASQLTSGNINGAISQLTSGTANNFTNLLNGANLNNVATALSTGNLNNYVQQLGTSALGNGLSNFTSGTLNGVFPQFTAATTNSALSQAPAAALAKALPQLTSGNLSTALGQLTTGNLTSVLNGLGTTATGLANTLGTLGSTALNSLLTGMSSANLQSLLSGLNLAAVTGVLGSLTSAALGALAASLPAGFLGTLTGAAVAALPLPKGADLADGSVISPCGSCACEDADQIATRQHIVDDYKATDDFITAQFEHNMEWILEDFFKTYFVRALKMMTEQLVTNGMNQMLAVGAIFDAKTQLETQRLFQQKTAEAHKDYQPAVDMCVWGTVAERLPGAEARVRLTAHSMSQHSLYRELGNGDTLGADDTASDALSRVEQVRNLYCNPNDNMKDVTYICNTGGPSDRRNHDIDYGRFMGDMPSLDINFDDAALTNDEQDVLMLANYLYSNHTFPRIPEPALNTLEGRETWLDVRSVIAQHNVAENSFDNIIALKSGAPNDTGSPPAADYMAVVLQRMGVSSSDAQEMLAMDNKGKKTARPSYYAQLQLLSQSIYQSPSFYVNLYDTPTNVTRKSVGMQAINLMLDRETYMSELREEAVLSQLLEAQVVKAQENLSNVADYLKRTEKTNP